MSRNSCRSFTNIVESEITNRCRFQAIKSCAFVDVCRLKWEHSGKLPWRQRKNLGLKFYDVSFFTVCAADFIVYAMSSVESFAHTLT